jgi:hypothetical protein
VLVSLLACHEKGPCITTYTSSLTCAVTRPVVVPVARARAVHFCFCLFSFFVFTAPGNVEQPTAVDVLVICMILHVCAVWRRRAGAGTRPAFEFEDAGRQTAVACVVYAMQSSWLWSSQVPMLTLYGSGERER